MRRICVFCGSSSGSRPEYVRVAKNLAHALVDRNVGLVYGGGSVGMMGELARTVLAANGEVIGVIPAFLAEREVAFEDLPDLRIVNSMHERKTVMVDLAEAFIALPGGLGTIEEFFEILTWAQLGIHTKPCGLVNACGYFDGLICFLDKAVEENFIMPAHRSMVLIDDSPENVLGLFDSYQPPKVDKTQWARGINNT